MSKDHQRMPNGIKREPKGARRVPKVAKRPPKDAKWNQKRAKMKPKGAKGTQKGTEGRQKGTKGGPKCMQKSTWVPGSVFDAKSGGSEGQVLEPFWNHLHQKGDLKSMHKTM